jgi:mannose-6-phosphate isomerase-like protein (cupin superfamily)
MEPKVISYQQESEYYFEENCHINELSNRVDDEALSIARARVKPGEKTRWHKLLDRKERYVILQGEGFVEIADSPPQLVQPGDVVLIPENCPQRIENRGEEDLVFLALCTPRFIAESYVDIEGAG